MDVILALNTALKARNGLGSLPKRSEWNVQQMMNLKYEWSVECVPHALLKDTYYVSEDIVVELGNISG